MKKEKFSIDNIPKVDDPLRRHLIKFTNEGFYKEELKNRGLPFFSEEELSGLEDAYKEKGITREDLMNEIRKKGWLLKENTIKSYIQKGLIPRATERVKTDRGMVSLYPSDTIRHLNLVRYWLFSKRNQNILNFLKTIFKMKHNDLTILEDCSKENSDGYDVMGDDCINAFELGITHLVCNADPWIEKSIKKAFLNNEEKKKLYLNKYREIGEMVGVLEKRLEEFKKLLEENESSLTEEQGKPYNLFYWRKFILNATENQKGK